MSFYGSLQVTAEKLLIDKGQRVVVRQVTATGYNPATGSSGSTVTNHTNIPAAVLAFKNMEIDGSKILKGDRKVIISGASLPYVPKVDDLVSIGGVDHKVMSCEPVSPGGVDVIYKVQVRK